MIYHAVSPDEWNASPDHPYAPASLAREGFVHCSPDERTTLAVVNAFYADVPGPLLVLVLDEGRLGAPSEWVEAVPAPPGVATGTSFPHVCGPVNRDAVVRILRVRWDGQGRAVGLTDQDPAGGPDRSGPVDGT